MDGFKWLLGQAEEKKSELILSVILAVLSVVCSTLPYFVVMKIVTDLLKGIKDVDVYLKLCLLLAGLWTLSTVLHSISTAKSHQATFHILAVLRKKCLNHLAIMPLGDVLDKGSGSLKNIIMERIDAMETPLAHILPEFTSGLLSPVIIIIAIFVLDWRMGLASLITLPLGMICYMCMMIGYDQNFKRAIAATKNLNDTTVEYINGIQVIKVFGKSQSSYDKFVLAAKEGANAYIEWMRKSNIFFTLARQLMPSTMISVLPIGALMYINGEISSITLISVIILAVGMIDPLIRCANYADDIGSLDTTVDEIKSILDAKTLERPESLTKTIENYDLSLKDIHFFLQR